MRSKGKELTLQAKQQQQHSGSLLTGSFSIEYLAYHNHLLCQRRIAVGSSDEVGGCGREILFLVICIYEC